MHDRAPSTKQKTILVIAKDRGLRLVVSASLNRDATCAVFTAASATVALAYPPVCTPDLIVYMMDSADQPTGPAVASMRCLVPFAALPVIVVGGAGGLLARAWPPTTFLPYPLRFADLTTRVAEIFGRVGAWP